MWENNGDRMLVLVFMNIEQDVDELDVDVEEEDIGEDLNPVLATEGRLHDAAVPVGASAWVRKV